MNFAAASDIKLHLSVLFLYVVFTLQYFFPYASIYFPTFHSCEQTTKVHEKIFKHHYDGPIFPHKNHDNKVFFSFIIIFFFFLFKNQFRYSKEHICGYTHLTSYQIFSFCSTFLPSIENDNSHLNIVIWRHCGIERFFVTPQEINWKNLAQSPYNTNMQYLQHFYRGAVTISVSIEKYIFRSTSYYMFK